MKMFNYYIQYTTQIIDSCYVLLIKFVFVSSFHVMLDSL